MVIRDLIEGELESNMQSSEAIRKQVLHPKFITSLQTKGGGGFIFYFLLSMIPILLPAVYIAEKCSPNNIVLLK